MNGGLPSRMGVPMDANAQPCLAISGLTCGYGQKRVINDVSLHVMPGEIVALIGPNGAGKSTLLKSLFGLVRVYSGKLHLNGTMIANFRPSALARAGMAYVPQGGRVFPDLNVRENLEMGALVCGSKEEVSERIAQMVSLFPVLGARKRQQACKLSGGEKQMLALAQAFMVHPTVLLLDEPSLGLSPQATLEALSAVSRLNRSLGTAVLLVEQNVHEALQIADRVYVLRQGEVVLETRPAEVTMDDLRAAFLDWGRSALPTAETKMREATEAD